MKQIPWFTILALKSYIVVPKSIIKFNIFALVVFLHVDVVVAISEREKERVCFRSAILPFMKRFNNVFIPSNTVHYTYRQNSNSRRGSDLADNRGQYIKLLFREDILDAILKIIYLQWSNCGPTVVEF